MSRHPSHRRTPGPSLSGSGLALSLLLLVGAVLSGASAARDTTVLPAADSAPATTYGIWSDTTVPAMPADPDTSRMTLGVKFTSSVNGWIEGIRFYRAKPNRGPHSGHLWTATGNRLAKVDFPASDTVGWHTARLDTLVHVTASTRYVASYTAPAGRYAGDQYALSPRRPAVTRDLTALKGVYTYGSGMPTDSWRNSNYYVDVLFTPGASPTGLLPVPEPTPTPEPQPTPEPEPTPEPTPTPDPTTGAFPDASNTGVPSGTRLTSYSGPCTITMRGTVIDAKEISCSLTIKAADVTINRSRINGTVATEENSTGYSYTITDSDVVVGDRPGTGFGSVNFTAVRVHVQGGNRSVKGWHDCVVRDSY